MRGIKWFVILVGVSPPISRIYTIFVFFVDAHFIFWCEFNISHTFIIPRLSQNKNGGSIILCTFFGTQRKTAPPPIVTHI